MTGVFLVLYIFSFALFSCEGKVLYSHFYFLMFSSVFQLLSKTVASNILHTWTYFFMYGR